MLFEPTHIPDVIIITPEVISDERGWFMETYSQRAFAEAGLPTEFKQDNISISKRGTLRGLHYQMEQPQGKLVQALEGEIYNLSLDIRASSPTFGKWHGCLLSAENKKSVYLPPGFAHGILAISPIARVLYKVTQYYHPQSQRTIYWKDPTLAIPWSLPEGAQMLLSPRDRSAPILQNAEVFE